MDSCPSECGRVGLEGAGVLTNPADASGEGPLVALRVATPTPTAVVLHGLSPDELWEYAPQLARTDGYSLAVTEQPLKEMLAALRDLP